MWFKKREEQNTNELNERHFTELSRRLDKNTNQQFNTDRLRNYKVSYKWQSNPDAELPALYQLLIANQLIHPDTTEEQLKAVFTAQPLQRIQPIRWHDDNASELLYFVLQLESTESIEAGKQTNYRRLKDCFVKPDGNRFDSVFKVLKTRIHDDLSEQKQQMIRSIVNSFL